MDAVIIDPPADVIAERQRLGLDRYDEVWDGEYHMVPTANTEHQRMEAELTACLLPIARVHGLEFLFEINLIPPNTPGWNDFRVPDIVVFRPELDGDRGVIGPASLAVEIRSPGDESFEKLPFYERLGVEEVLIIDRDTKVVRRWVNGEGGLEETEPDEGGFHGLDCLPVAFGRTGARLLVRTPRGMVAI